MRPNACQVVRPVGSASHDVWIMRLFYRKLWAETLPPLDALRQVQLALYHHAVHPAELR